jgi:DNA-binding NtrC family response regulator
MAERNRITHPAGDAVVPAPVALRLCDASREWPLPSDGGRLGIGSDPSNELVLDDRFVSSFHCSLERANGRLLVRDQRSRNGTLVNGTRVRECEVRVGTRLTVGETTLLLVGDGRTGARSAAELLITADAGFRATLETAERAARSAANILILGESGTGKELVARLVHEASPYAPGPFVALNCGAIARDLVESELFGHERGAFTGAAERRLGVFEQAHGGTLFLDEVGELPLSQQPRLLRVLETRRLRRVGGQEERALDVRIVAATHRDLRAASAAGGFRTDLYHRLATVELRLAPLRERPADVALLARRFLEELAGQLGERRLGAEAQAILEAHPWPGNVRELRNTVQRAAMFSDGEIGAADLFAQLQAGRAPLAAPPVAVAGEPRPVQVDDAVRDMVERALRDHPSYRAAARAIGMPKSTLHDLARRYGFKR